MSEPKKDHLQLLTEMMEFFTKEQMIISYAIQKLDAEKVKLTFQPHKDYLAHFQGKIEQRTRCNTAEGSYIGTSIDLVRTCWNMFTMLFQKVNLNNMRQLFSPALLRKDRERFKNWQVWHKSKLEKH